MDTETNPANVVHKPPPLNSDQLNYLIWRYLQEAGYAEAAVKLQRDWKVDTSTFPWAKYIKGQALVSLVQKGLRYHHLSLTVDENGQQTKTLVPSMFFFGPESAGADSVSAPKEALLKGSDSVRGVSPASTIANASKMKSRDTISNAPEDPTPQPPKRGRKPMQSQSADRAGATARKISGTTEPEAMNGQSSNNLDVTPPTPHENHTEDVTLPNGVHDDGMDIDPVAPMNDVAMDDPIDESFPVLVPTLTNGENKAVQVAPAKVSNLGPTSAILSLGQSQIINRALWRPADAATLIAQGETFCGVFNLNGQDLQPDSVKPMPNNLFPSNEAILVTAAAWNPDGSALALATYSEQEGQIHLFEGQDLALFESLPASQRAITMLRWHPSSTQLIGVSPFEEGGQNSNVDAGSSLLSWDLASGSGVSPPTALSLPSTIYDIDCPQNATNQDIYVACENAVYQCSSLKEIVINEQWTQRNSSVKEIWTFIRGTHVSSVEKVAVAAAAETATLWIPQRDLWKENAHGGSITGLEIRPRQHPTNGAYRQLEFATSSLDGTIKVWEVAENGTEITCSHQLRFEPSSSVMTLSYSPDGFCLAGASYSTARIWNAEHSYNLMASWEGLEPDWRGTSIKDDDLASAGGRSSINGDGVAGNADHTLAWHSDSKRLAFGLGSQVAVINFQR